VILEVDRKPVDNAEKFMEILEQTKDRKSLLFLTHRGERSLYLTVTRR